MLPQLIKPHQNILLTLLVVSACTPVSATPAILETVESSQETTPTLVTSALTHTPSPTKTPEPTPTKEMEEPSPTPTTEPTSTPTQEPTSTPEPIPTPEVETLENWKESKALIDGSVISPRIHHYSNEAWEDGKLAIWMVMPIYPMVVISDREIDSNIYKVRIGFKLNDQFHMFEVFATECKVLSPLGNIETILGGGGKIGRRIAPILRGREKDLDESLFSSPDEAACRQVWEGIVTDNGEEQYANVQAFFNSGTIDPEWNLLTDEKGEPIVDLTPYAVLGNVRQLGESSDP